MQAGRELDAKVAEALGLVVQQYELDDSFDNAEIPRFIVEGDNYTPLPHYSTTWEAMGVLVEEAVKKQDIYLKVEADPHGGYEAGAWDERDWINYGSITAESAPHAVCIAFLKAMRIAI